MDTGISLQAADQLVVVGGVTDRSLSDVGATSRSENDRGSVKRRQVASAFCGTPKPPVACGSAADDSESAKGSHSESISLVRRVPLQCTHMSISRTRLISFTMQMPHRRLHTHRQSVQMSAGPWVVPIRGNLDDIARLMAGDVSIGRGSRQRGLLASPFSNPYKVGEYGRVNAIHLFEQHLDNSPELIKLVPSLSGKRLVCHCSKGQSCHGDILVKKFVELFPGAYDRNAPEQRPPTSSELNLRATHREEQPSDDGSSADENVPEKGAGWTGVGPPLQVGVGYSSRDYCDGQGLRSPGRWRVESRRYPCTTHWKKVMAKFAKFVDARCTPSLLMKLAMGKVETCPFDDNEIAELKENVVAGLASDGFELHRQQGDREDVPIDFRLLGLLLSAPDDPEVGLGSFAQGVRVGPGSRMPRFPALYDRRRNGGWYLRRTPGAYLEEEGHESESSWRRNYATLLPLSKEVMDVLTDQTRRGQLIRLSEEEAKIRFPPSRRCVPWCQSEGSTKR